MLIPFNPIGVKNIEIIHLHMNPSMIKIKRKSKHSSTMVIVHIGNPNIRFIQVVEDYSFSYIKLIK